MNGERPRCQHCPNTLADERSFMCEDCASKADEEAQTLRDQLEGAVQTLAELKEAHEAEGHTVRGLIGQRLRRAITEAEHVLAAHGGQ